ncbi:MAG: hypothetical protein NTW87_31670 [Planctomycetota bacterium]|nr:hypothetical protein [Planctomycetota bacterium]
MSCGSWLLALGSWLDACGAWLCCGVLAAQQGLTREEQTRVEAWLAIIGGFLFLMIVGLLGLAIAIRYIAKRSTQPCPWCMEFISKKATVCPRCGKSVTPSNSEKA